MIPWSLSMPRSLLLLVTLPALGCASAPAAVHHANVGRSDGAEWANLVHAFEERNPGYTLNAHPHLEALGPVDHPGVLFVQGGPSEMHVRRPSGGEVRSEVDVGDVVLLEAGSALVSSPPVTSVVFGLPGPLPEGLPVFVRPDWDPSITDTPGGCATETGAYRRILLTWLPANGAYVSHALNAHRVRITDSFTHYHPVDGGFDEFYLVQMVQPGARLLTSEAVDSIEAEDLTADAAGGVFTERPLAVGDLVYMPRGTIHRGLDGVLAQVIAVPGFVPGMEIGVDEHLRSINAKLGLEAREALPFHE